MRGLRLSARDLDDGSLIGPRRLWRRAVERRSWRSTLVAIRATVDLVSKTIGQRELRNDNAKVIDAVAAGETFVVTRNGTPVAELRPVQVRRPSLVARAAIIEAAAQGPTIDAARFRLDLDDVVDQRL